MVYSRRQLRGPARAAAVAALSVALLLQLPQLRGQAFATPGPARPTRVPQAATAGLIEAVAGGGREAAGAAGPDPLGARPLLALGAVLGLVAALATAQPAWAAKGGLAAIVGKNHSDEVTFDIDYGSLGASLDKRSSGGKVDYSVAPQATVEKKDLSKFVNPMKFGGAAKAKKEEAPRSAPEAKKVEAPSSAPEAKKVEAPSSAPEAKKVETPSSAPEAKKVETPSSAQEVKKEEASSAPEAKKVEAPSSAPEAKKVEVPSSVPEAKKEEAGK